MFDRSLINKIIISLALVSLWGLVGWPAQAADLKIKLANSAYHVGDTISIKIILISTDQPANALSGTLIFPSDKLAVSSLNKTGSLINIWTQEPSFTNSGGQVSFEGAILNPGYTGATGQILNVVFKAKKAGSVNLTFSRGSVLASDGQGTAILNNLGQANFIINEKNITAPAPKPVASPTIIPSPPIVPSTATTSVDTNPPTGLFIEEIKDPRGEGYAKFNLSATDQLSGLANYILQIDGGVEEEIDSSEKTWQTPKLPAGEHRLLVQAVDRAGNSVGLETNFTIIISRWSGLLVYFETHPQLLVLAFSLVALTLLIILIWLSLAWRQRSTSPKPNFDLRPVASTIIPNPALAQVVFSGRAYPTNDVSVLLADQVLAKTRTGLDGRFEISLDYLTVGNYNFSLKALDNLTHQTITQIFPMTLTAGVTIRTTDIFLVPTYQSNLMPNVN